jgi:hypothetical protein
MTRPQPVGGIYIYNNNNNNNKIYIYVFSPFLEAHSSNPDEPNPIS